MTDSRSWLPVDWLLITAISLMAGPVRGQSPVPGPRVVAAADVPSAPALPGNWRMVPEFSDEFNLPELNRKKWQTSNADWYGRPPAFYQDGNVEVKDGKLHLNLKAGSVPNMPEGYKDYTCATICSRKRIRYGYFEIRAQMADSVGVSAFWFYHNEPERWTEIDVFELAPAHKLYGRTHFTNAPVLRYPGLTGTLAHQEEFPLKEDPSKAFHTWGLLWEPGILTWYYDGKPLRSLANTHWKTPLRMIIDTETHPDWMGLPDPKSLPAVFIVDYVRTWQNLPP